MKALETLPDGYKEIYSVNLQKDKKIALLINGLALLIGVIMAVPMHFYIPITTLFSTEKGLLNYALRLSVMLLSVALYMLCHELIHGITMKGLGTKKVKYGFTGMYAFAGSDDYYDKKSYIIIALMPVVVFLFVFLFICAAVPREWFWVVYFLQITNISGAAGDFFVTVRFMKMPKDILVRDSGVGMTVYSNTEPFLNKF